MEHETLPEPATPSTDGEQQRALLLIDNAIKVLPIAIAIAFVGSVFYDWGFARAIGLRLMDLPMTLADHSRTTILWAPLLLVVVLFQGGFNMWMDARVARRRGKATTPEFLPAPVPMGYRRNPRGRWRIAFLVWAVAIALIFLLGRDGSPATYMAWLATWTAMVASGVTPERFGERRANALASILTLVGVQLTVFFVIGNAMGNFSLSSAAKDGQQILFQDASGTERRVALIRSYEDFVVAVSDEDRIQIVPKEQVLRMEGRKAIPRHPGLLCTAWNIRCPERASGKKIGEGGASAR